MTELSARQFLNQELGDSFVITDQYEEKEYIIFLFQSSEYLEKKNINSMSTGYGPILLDKRSKQFKILGSGATISNYLSEENLVKYRDSSKDKEARDSLDLLESIKASGYLSLEELLMVVQRQGIQLGDEYAQAMLTTDDNGDYMIYSTDLPALAALHALFKNLGSQIKQHPKEHLFIPNEVK